MFGWNLPENPSDEFLNAQNLYRLDMSNRIPKFGGLFYNVETNIVLNGSVAEYVHTASLRTFTEARDILHNLVDGSDIRILRILESEGSVNIADFYAVLDKDEEDWTAAEQQLVNDVKSLVAAKITSVKAQVNALADFSALRSFLANDFGADGVEFNAVLSTDDSHLTTGETATITITLTESSTDLSINSLTATGGTLSNFSGSGTTYTVTFTPDVDSNTDGVVTLLKDTFTNGDGENTRTNEFIVMTVDTLVVSTTYTVTVANNVFEIDGVAQDDLVLAVGTTYRFNQDDSSNAGHPLRIFAPDDDGVPTLFTEGVVIVGTPGTATSYTQFTPPAVDDYTYDCLNHPGMGGNLH